MSKTRKRHITDEPRHAAESEAHKVRRKIRQQVELFLETDNPEEAWLEDDDFVQFERIRRRKPAK